MERWEVVLASCRGLGLDDDKVELHCIAVLMLSSCARGRHGWLHSKHTCHTRSHIPKHRDSVVCDDDTKMRGDQPFVH